MAFTYAVERVATGRRSIRVRQMLSTGATGQPPRSLAPAATTGAAAGDGPPAGDEGSTEGDCVTGGNGIVEELAGAATGFED
jgi:hypothetical protein